MVECTNSESRFGRTQAGRERSHRRTRTVCIYEVHTGPRIPHIRELVSAVVFSLSCYAPGRAIFFSGCKSPGADSPPYSWRALPSSNPATHAAMVPTDSCHRSKIGLGDGLPTLFQCGFPGKSHVPLMHSLQMVGESNRHCDDRKCRIGVATRRKHRGT